MDMLEELRKKNPRLPLFSVLDPAFAPYGRVLLVLDPASLRAALAQTRIPEAGNCYTASDPVLEATPDVRHLADTVYGGMAVQAGCCNGRGFTLNAEEYHKCSEVNYSTTGLVLLLALPGDIHDRHLDASAVVGFYLPPEVMVEIHPLVLHFAPCRVRPEGGRRGSCGCGTSGSCATRIPPRPRRALLSASPAKTCSWPWNKGL